MKPQRDWYTTAEAAAELGLSPASLRDALRRGAIHATALTPHLRTYTREEIERYRREHLGRSGWATRRALPGCAATRDRRAPSHAGAHVTGAGER